jgi:hypothetical protein
MAQPGLRIRGADELERAFKQVRKEVLRGIRPALRLAAEPVRMDAETRFSGFSPRSARGYKVRVRMRGVAVEQSLGRTTGTRPDFGSLQMQEALLPALDAKQAVVVRTFEQMVDRAGRKAGF